MSMKPRAHPCHELESHYSDLPGWVYLGDMWLKVWNYCIFIFILFYCMPATSTTPAARKVDNNSASPRISWNDVKVDSTMLLGILGKSDISLAPTLIISLNHLLFVDRCWFVCFFIRIFVIDIFVSLAWFSSSFSSPSITKPSVH